MGHVFAVVQGLTSRVERGACCQRQRTHLEPGYLAHSAPEGEEAEDERHAGAEETEPANESAGYAAVHRTEVGRQVEQRPRQRLPMNRNTEIYENHFGLQALFFSSMRSYLPPINVYVAQASMSTIRETATYTQQAEEKDLGKATKEHTWYIYTLVCVQKNKHTPQLFKIEDFYLNKSLNSSIRSLHPAYCTLHLGSESTIFSRTEVEGQTALSFPLTMSLVH